MARELPPVPLQALDEDDPRELGGYRLLGRLGEGGMGIAFLAEGPDGWAVIKTMWPNLRSDPSYRSRLARELDALTAAASPRVVRLLDQDLTGRNPWFAMEFISGMTLARRVADFGALPGAEVGAIARGLAEALAATQAAGVVHRDLKPANVMLGPQGPVLIDFGVADVSEATQLTRTGLIVGSAGWLAPEQITGGEVTSAADVHAWALCVLYAATGVAAFGGDNPTATIYQVLQADPEVPTTLGEPLVTLLKSAVSKDPLDRPSPKHLVDSFENELRQANPTEFGATPSHDTAASGAPATRSGTRDSGPPNDLSRSSQRARAALLALILVGLVIIGIGFVKFRGSGSTVDASSETHASASAARAVVPSGSQSLGVSTSSLTTEEPPKWTIVLTCGSAPGWDPSNARYTIREGHPEDWAYLFSYSAITPGFACMQGRSREDLESGSGFQDMSGYYPGLADVWERAVRQGFPFDGGNMWDLVYLCTVRDSAVDVKRSASVALLTHYFKGYRKEGILETLKVCPTTPNRPLWMKAVR